jgi:hypothetical protein
MQTVRLRVVGWSAHFFGSQITTSYFWSQKHSIAFGTESQECCFYLLFHNALKEKPAQCIIFMPLVRKGIVALGSGVYSLWECAASDYFSFSANPEIP